MYFLLRIVDIGFLYGILLIRTCTRLLKSQKGAKIIMVTKLKETNPFSIKNIYKSIVSPSSSGREAAKEYIKNSAKKHTNVSTDAVFKNIGDRLSTGESYVVKGFGTFGVKKRATRTAINPRTGEKIQIKAMDVPFFKASKKLKEKIEK